MAKTGTGKNKTIKLTMACLTNLLLALKGINELTLKDNMNIQTPLGSYIDGNPYK